MRTFTEGNLVFHFWANHLVERVDQWATPPKVKQRPKAVDFAVCRRSAGDRRYWLLEVKDYRVLQGTPKALSSLEMAQDFIDKIAGSMQLIQWQAATGNEGAITLSKKQERIPVLHMELPISSSRIAPFPKGIQASVLQKLRQTHANCLVLDTRTKARVPWTVSPTAQASKDL
jgi:hypothetical protein